MFSTFVMPFYFCHFLLLLLLFERFYIYVLISNLHPTLCQVLQIIHLQYTLYICVNCSAARTCVLVQGQHWQQHPNVLIWHALSSLCSCWSTNHLLGKLLTTHQPRHQLLPHQCLLPAIQQCLASDQYCNVTTQLQNTTFSHCRWTTLGCVSQSTWSRWKQHSVWQTCNSQTQFFMLVAFNLILFSLLDCVLV